MGGTPDEGGGGYAAGVTPSHPGQCAATLLQDAVGRILFIRQSYGRQFWGFAGGVVDSGETPLQAAVREVKEEVGLESKLTGLIGCYLLTGGGWPDIQAYVFVGESQGTALQLDPAEIAEALWLPPEHAPDFLLPDVEAALHDWQAGRMGVVRNVTRRSAWADQLSPLS